MAFLPEDKRRKSLFQFTTGRSWKTIAEWVKESKISSSQKLECMGGVCILQVGLGQTHSGEDLQKQLVVLNKKKTCFCVPMLGSNIQQWLYQEALEGRWDQDMVSGVLERQESENGAVVSAKVKNLGLYI